MIKNAFIQSLVLCGAVFTSWAWADETPQEVVQKTTDEMIIKVKEAKPFYEKEPQRMTQAVDEVLSKIADIDRIAKGVMAKYYKQATPEQQKRFTEKFEQSLMQTYARGMAQYDDNKVEVLPQRAGEKLDPESTPVRMKIYLKDNNYLDVIYTMFQNEQGQWKLKNVIINGINLGLTFRNQFSEAMQKNHNDIDKVIAEWSSDVDTTKDNTKASADAGSSNVQ